MPFFGVPIRNGLPIGLGSVAGFGVQQFDPSLLFEGGTVAGAWYDPSDLSTMFTTSAGTTPVAMPGGGAAVSVGRMLDKSGNGNHAIAFNNTTARPELRARVNLLTYSEEFDNGAWTKTNVTILANSITAPDGTTTADTVIETATTNTHLVDGYPQIGPAGYPAGTFAFTCYAKAKERSAIALSVNTSITSQWTVATFDLTTGVVSQTGTGGGGVFTLVASSIIDAGNGWYQCVLRFSATAIWWPNIQILNATTYVYGNYGRFSYTGDGTSGVFIWGADLRPANIGANVPAYQRIADANTYDTSGFPLYLFFDGIDDSMYTPANLNLSGTDKVAVFAGVRKLSDAVAYPTIAELSATASGNDGSFAVYASANSTPRYGFYVRGTAVSGFEPQTYAAPVSNVLACAFDIAGAARDDEIQPKINGVLNQTNPVGSANAGTGNFGTYPLFIGSRNNSSLWLNGQLYSLIIAGSAVSAGNISATEQWVAGKTGVFFSPSIANNFNILPSTGSPSYAVTNNTLNSSGFVFVVSSTVLSSNGTSYSPI